MNRGEARQRGAFDRDFELIDYRLVERQVFSDLRSLPSFLNKTADLRADDEKSCSRFEETGFGEYPMGKKKREAACDRQKFRVASTEGFVCGHHMPPKHASTSICFFLSSVWCFDSPGLLSWDRDARFGNTPLPPSPSMSGVSPHPPTTSESVPASTPGGYPRMRNGLHRDECPDRSVLRVSLGHRLIYLSHFVTARASG